MLLWYNIGVKGTNISEAIMKSKTNKTKGINKRYTLVLKTLDALETSKYTGNLDLYWCVCSIDWLWRWKKITKVEFDSLCERVMSLQGLV
jgi:hypothetical protein